MEVGLWLDCISHFVYFTVRTIHSPVEITGLYMRSVNYKSTAVGNLAKSQMLSDRNFNPKDFLSNYLWP